MPFHGGKRICIGKTFAEVQVKFTLPILYHFFDFEFVDYETQSAHKPKYGAGSKEHISMPMRLTVREGV